MALRLAEHFARCQYVVHLIASPLQRAQETITPLADALDLPIHTDERVTEAESVFQGLDLAPNPRQLLHPRYWLHMRNPWRPSWAEPYREQIARMTSAIRAARAAAEGNEAVIVSHQSPIWLMRRSLEGRSFLHDPRHRECTLASVTTLTFDGTTLTGIDYSEPCADLLVGASAIT